MSFRVSISLVFLTFFLTACGHDTEDTALAIPDRPDFIFDVKPLLSDRCFACHGPDEEKQKAGLALHTADRAYAVLKDKPGKYAIVPGNPEKSELYRRIISKNKALVMPPPESHLTLAEHEQELLRRWIEQGAEYKPHWAFTAPEEVIVPKPDQMEWVRNPVDNFVLTALEDRGFKTSPEADKNTLLRRVTFDLTGLPPSREEIEDFLKDNSPDAYERVVDRLLASPHYGENMAVSWLDLSRYADSHGYQDDRPRSMWPWRDWVVKAFNDNLSYRDFVTWQLAGDLLPDPTYEQRLATGFNRNHPITQEGGIIQEEYLAEYSSDRAHVFGTAFLGLTVECAKCHTHKYDPITHEDYYQLTAFFNNITEAGDAGGYYNLAPKPNLTIEDPALVREMADVEKYIESLEATQRELETSIGIPAEKLPVETEEQLLAKGLVAHYRLDEISGSRAKSALPDGQDGWINYNLPPTFTPAKAVAGRQDGGLRFDGENYLSLGMVGDFEHHQPFSASLWIKHDGRGKQRALFGKRMDELRHNGYDLILTKANYLAFRLAGSWWAPDQYPEGLEALEVRTTSRVPAGSWQHVAVTYDGSGRADGVQIYLGGKAQEQSTVADNLKQHTILNGNQFALGNWNQRGRIKGNLGGFANGVIDEFRLYERELSSVDIALLTRTAPAAAPLNAAAFSPKDLHQHQLLHYSTSYRRNLELLDSLRSIDRSIPKVMVMEEKDTLTPTFIRIRGEYDQLGGRVNRKAPSALPPLPEAVSTDRLGLAQWLFSEDHPLTARVAVNRLWQQCFGKGLVTSTADFGNQGDLPSHPQLLDYLANHYRTNGWDTKALLRLLVTSATYRQSAILKPGDQERDPDNRWLARGPAQKLTAEMLRDQALQASGLLDDKIGGKWVKPYQPAGLWYEMASEIGEPVYRPSRGKNLFRRSLYTYFKRTIPPPDMLTLDAAERTVCTVKRQKTSTPLQSLVVLNAPIFLEASRHLAQDIMQKQPDENTLIQEAFQRILSRPAAEEEKAILQEVLWDNLAYFTASPGAAEELLSTGATQIAPDLDPEKLAAATMMVSTLFNLDEAQRK